LYGGMVRGGILNDFDLDQAVMILRRQIWTQLGSGDQAGSKALPMSVSI
jgi:hypothetical protein